MFKKTLLFLITANMTLIGISGCSSVMTHSGPYQGYYPGSRASLAVLEDHDTDWSLIPFAVIDLPFSTVLDTLLLPYDYLRRNSDKTLESPRERMLHGDSSSHHGGTRHPAK